MHQQVNQLASQCDQMIRQMVTQTNQNTRTYQQIAQTEEQNARELERLVQREHQTAQTIQNIIRSHEQSIQQLNQLQSLVGQISQTASIISNQNWQLSSQFNQSGVYNTPVQYGQQTAGQYSTYSQDAYRQAGQSQIGLSPTAQAALGQTYYASQPANQAASHVSNGFGQVGSQFGPNGQDNFSPSQTLSPMISSFSGANRSFQ